MFSDGISEIVLSVQDVHRAARFYRDVLGLEPDGEPDGDWAWFWAGKAGDSQRIAVTNRPLIYEDRSPGPSLAGKRFGPVHFAFRVPRSRLEEAVAHVRANEVEVHGPRRIEWMKAESYYFHDPDGNLLEFWSPDEA